jgi:hypothetical protein
MLEVLVRLITPDDNLRVTATADFYRNHETRGFTHKPDLRKATYWNGQRIQVRTNKAGRRVPHDQAFAEMRGRRQVLLSGDSYTFGNEVNAEDTFAYLLRDLSEFDSINLGVGAYGTRQQLDALEEFVESEGGSLVDTVLLFFFVGNDYTDNTKPLAFYSVDDDGRLTRDGTTNALLARRLVYSSHALSFIYMRIKPLLSQWRYRDASVAQAHIYSDSFYTHEILEATRKALEEFRNYTDRQGFRFAVVVIPEKDQLYKVFENEDDRLLPNRVLGRILDDLGIVYLDLLPHLERRRDESIYNMIPEGHLSANGHQVVAKLLIDLLETPDLEQMPTSGG